MSDEKEELAIFKQSHLTFLPEGWNLDLVGNAYRIRDELRFPISEVDRRERKGLYPYYGPTGIVDYINTYNIDGFYALIGEDGDHFLKSSERSMTQIIHGKFNVNNHAHIIEGTDKCSAKWFFYYFMHRDITHILSRQGAGRYKLTKAALQKLPILLPTLDEQHHLTNILSTWDHAIALTTQLITAKQQYKRGLMYQLLTGHHRFKEFANSSWSTLNAGDIFQSYSIRNNGEEQLLSVTQDQGVIPRSMLDTRVVMPAGETTSYKFVEPGNFIISLRSFQGGIEYSKYRGLVSPAYTVLKPKRPIVDSFYKHLFKSQNFISHLGVAIIGIRDGKQINFDDFASIRLAYPTPEEQQRIAEVFDTCDNELKLLHHKLALLKKQKQGLMQQLLTGKVRVKT